LCKWSDQVRSECWTCAEISTDSPKGEVIMWAERFAIPWTQLSGTTAMEIPRKTHWASVDVSCDRIDTWGDCR
jgi:hypothetical protein